MNCHELRGALHPYLDGELDAKTVLRVEAHLVDCESCRKEYEGLLSAVESVRGANRLFEPSEESRRGVEKLIQAHRLRTAWAKGGLAAATLVAVIGAFGILQRAGEPRDPFAALAAESHLRYSRGTLPLDVQSENPQQVASWLSSRLPFHLTLPNYRPLTGQTKPYRLEGARLLQYGEADVAYLAYRMGGRPISLLMTSSARVIPAGGNMYRSGGLEFHMATYKGLRMITWTDKGLSYALVSDLDAAGAESCMICHGEESERQKFEQLRPKL